MHIFLNFCNVLCATDSLDHFQSFSREFVRAYRFVSAERSGPEGSGLAKLARFGQAG